MICSNCGSDKPCTPKYFPVLHGRRKGRVCRDCKNKRDGHQSPQSGTCQHCHEPIVGRPKTTRYHTDSSHPACYAAKQAHILEQQKSYDRGAGKAWRKARAETSPRKQCERCIDIGVKPPRLVKKGNRKFCEKCFQWASNLSIDFVGW